MGYIFFYNTLYRLLGELFYNDEILSHHFTRDENSTRLCHVALRKCRESEIFCCNFIKVWRVFIVVSLNPKFHDLMEKKMNIRALRFRL